MSATHTDTAPRKRGRPPRRELVTPLGGAASRPAEIPPITVSIAGASAASGLAHSTIRLLIREGKLRSVKVRGRRLVFVDSLHRLLNTGA